MCSDILPTEFVRQDFGSYVVVIDLRSPNQKSCALACKCSDVLSKYHNVMDVNVAAARHRRSAGRRPSSPTMSMLVLRHAGYVQSS